MNTAKKWLRDAKSAGKFDKWTPFGLWSLKYMYFLLGPLIKLESKPPIN
jgi:hypothetical protein